jgi:hypothetical protein
MKYTVEMGSAALIYIPSFIKISLGIQKLIGRDSQTHKENRVLISLLSFFENKECRLKMLTHVVYEQRGARHINILTSGLTEKLIGQTLIP